MQAPLPSAGSSLARRRAGNGEHEWQQDAGGRRRFGPWGRKDAVPADNQDAHHDRRQQGGPGAHRRQRARPLFARVDCPHTSSR